MWTAPFYVCADIFDNGYRDFDKKVVMMMMMMVLMMMMMMMMPGNDAFLTTVSLAISSQSLFVTPSRITSTWQ